MATADRLFKSMPIPLIVHIKEGPVRTNLAASRLLDELDVRDVAAFSRAIESSFDADDNFATRSFSTQAKDGSIRRLSVTLSRSAALGYSIYALTDSTMAHGAELTAFDTTRSAVVGDLSFSIAHELRQPLAVIRQAASNGFKRARDVEDDVIREKFRRIEDQVDRAVRIMEHILALSRPHQSVTTFNPAPSVQLAVGLLSQQFHAAGITLDVYMNIEDTVSIAGSSVLFESAVLNLLQNAQQALENVAGTGRVILRVEQNTSVLILSVSDNAGGIPATVLSRIFKPFVSTKDARSHMGLGLSIAKLAIDSMGGRIVAANGEIGAIFTITLPLANVRKHSVATRG